jgi:hypothetical protein
MGIRILTDMTVSATKFTPHPMTCSTDVIKNTLVIGSLVYEVAYITRSTDCYCVPLREGTHPVFNELTKQSINDIRNTCKEDEVALVERLIKFCPYLMDIPSIIMLYEALLINDDAARLHFSNANKLLECPASTFRPCINEKSVTVNEAS